MSDEPEIIVKDGRRWQRLSFKVGETWPEGFVFEGVDEDTNRIIGIAPLEDEA